MDPIKETAEQTAESVSLAHYLVPEVLQPLIKAFEDDSARPFMIGIAILLILGTVIMVERLYMFLRVYRADAASLMQKVQRLILENNIDEAIKICNTNKRAGIYQIFKAALMNADRPFEEIQDHVEVATMGFVPKLQTRMSYLFTISNVSTLLGLLGTVMGLLGAFSAVGTFEGSQKQLALSAGIGLALNTTAFGLIAAIPCMLVYGWLYNQITAIMDEIEHYSGKLLLLLRTGSQYYEKFNSESSFTTQQKPQKLHPDQIPAGHDESSYDPGQVAKSQARQQQATRTQKKVPVAASHTPPPRTTHNTQNEEQSGTMTMERPPLVERPPVTQSYNVPSAPPSTYVEKKEQTRSQIIPAQINASVVNEDIEENGIPSAPHFGTTLEEPPTQSETNESAQNEDDLLDEYLDSQKKDDDAA